MLELIPPTEQEMQMAAQVMMSQWMQKTKSQNLVKNSEPEGCIQSIDTSKTEAPESPGTPVPKGGEI